MRKIKRVGVIVGAAFVALSLATPASAGWYIFIEAASVETSNAALIGANIESEVSGPGTFTETNRPLAAKIDEEFGGTIGIGYDALGGIVAVAYTTSSGDETSAPVTLDDVGSPTFAINDSMAGRGFFPEVGTATTFGDIERSTLDVMYFHLMNPGDKVETHWKFGLRAATYEEMITLNATGDDVGGGFPQSLVENYILDVDAYGVLFGGGAEVELGQNFSIYGNLTTSVLMAEVDENIVSVDTDPGFVSTDSLVDSRDASGMIWDVAVGAKVLKRENFEIGVEYQLSSWNNLVDRQALGSEDLDDAHFASRNNVSFHGVAINVLFRLGGD